MGADGSPALGSFFSHKGEGVANLLVVIRIDIFVDEEISPD